MSPRRQPLVTQHLEKVSRKMLEEHQDILKEFCGREPGLYALYRRGKLHYIGLAGNLMARLKQHLRDRHGSSWDTFSIYLTIGDKHMKELESLMLRIVDPPGNKMTGKFAKSENIKRKVGVKINRKLKEEASMLLGGSLKPKSKSQQKTSFPKKSKVTGRRPMLAEYVDRIPSPNLRATYKGKTVRARVRKDGSISCHGQVYNSPSSAGIAVIARPCNGWHFWFFQRSPGNWVRLSSLRKK